MKKIKVAVIGVGNISYYHIQGYLSDPDAELVAFCDINPETLARRGKEFGVTKLFENYEDMFREVPEIDVVSVCTWNNAHAPAAIAALKAGKHVLCEKPMAMNAKEAQEMRAAALENGRILQIGFVRRFGRDAALVRDFEESGDLGEIYYARASYVRRNGNPGGWFGDKSRSGGGPLIDLGVHVIDLVRYLMGNPRPVSVYGATFTKLGNRPDVRTPRAYAALSSGNDVCDVEDMATALVRFENGAVLNVQAGFCLNLERDENEVSLFGTKGGVRLDPDFKLFTVRNGYLADVNLVAPSSFDFSESFCTEIRCFLEAVRGNAPVRATADDGVELMKILDAIYESARTGRETLLA